MCNVPNLFTQVAHNFPFKKMFTFVVKYDAKGVVLWLQITNSKNACLEYNNDNNNNDNNNNDLYTLREKCSYKARLYSNYNTLVTFV